MQRDRADGAPDVLHRRSETTQDADRGRRCPACLGHPRRATGSRQAEGRALKSPFVHIEKAMIVRHLRELGRHEDAIRADRELPDRIHTAQDVELFERFGLDPSGFEGETFGDRPPKEI
jgi:hypothetical protein